MIKVLESVEFEVVSTDMQRSWTNENLSDSPSLQSRPRLDSNQPYQNEQQSIVANAIALYGTKVCDSVTKAMGKHLEQALPSVYTLQCLTGKVDNNNNNNDKVIS